MNWEQRWNDGEVSNSEYMMYLLECLAKVRQDVLRKETKEADARMARLGIAPRE
jgi:hypothetical protein